MRAFEGKKEYKKMIDAMVTLYEKSDDFDYLDVDVFKKDKKKTDTADDFSEITQDDIDI